MMIPSDKNWMQCCALHESRQHFFARQKQPCRRPWPRLKLLLGAAPDFVECRRTPICVGAALVAPQLDESDTTGGPLFAKLCVGLVKAPNEVRRAILPTRRMNLALLTVHRLSSFMVTR